MEHRRRPKTTLRELALVGLLITVAEWLFYHIYTSWGAYKIYLTLNAPQEAALVVMLLAYAAFIGYVVKQRIDKAPDKPARMPWGTMLIFGLTLAVYFALSGFQPYVYPIAVMDPFGAMISTTLVSAWTYTFMHIGLKHLIGNMLIFAVLGAILEMRIGTKHLIGLYFASSGLAALLYTIAYPQVWVVGASAGISGAIIAAYIADFRKTFVLFIITLMVVPVIIFPITDLALNDMIVQQNKMIRQLREQASTVNVSIGETQTQMNATNLTAEERAALEAQLANQTQSLQEIQEQANTTAQKTTAVTSGRREEAITPASAMIHVLGVAVAIGYLWLFKRKIFYDLRDDIYGLLRIA